MRRQLLLGAAFASTAASMGFLPQFGSRTRTLGEVATVEIPRRARLEEPQRFREEASWVGFRLSRFHSWSIGSSTPYRANLFIAVHAKGAEASSYNEALDAALGELNGGFDDWKLLARGTHWEVGSGRYTVNRLNEPTWRLSYRDPSRRVSLLWQVYQKDWSLDDAKAAVLKMVASVRILNEPDFTDIADRPRREVESRERGVQGVLSWMAARGFGTLAPHQPVTHDGITAEYMVDPERRLMLYKAIAAPPVGALPAYVSYGWRVAADTGWEYHMPKGDYYPMRGTTQWLDRTLAKPGPHFFLIRTVRLDEQDEASFHIAEFVQFASTYR